MTLSFFRTRLILILFFFLAGSFLSGCVATTTPDTKFYVLNPLDPASVLVKEAAGTASLSVEVVSLRLPQYLERPQIVTRSGDNRLELAEYYQWGGNLGKDMSRVLAKNLSQLLGTPHIAIAPYRSMTSHEFSVDLEVMQFERGVDGRIRLSVHWRLSSSKDQKTLDTQITDLTSPATLTEKDFDQTVSAMSSLFGELSKIIAQAILRQAQGSPGP